jgi:hypothetical protein
MLSGTKHLLFSRPTADSSGFALRMTRVRKAVRPELLFPMALSLPKGGLEELGFDRLSPNGALNKQGFDRLSPNGALNKQGFDRLSPNGALNKQGFDRLSPNGVCGQHGLNVDGLLHVLFAMRICESPR